MWSKYAVVSQSILDEKVYIMCLTETWHSDLTDASLQKSAPESYFLLDMPRSLSYNSKQNGGGLAFIINCNLLNCIIKQLLVKFISFESLSLKIIWGNKVSPIFIILIYRPPTTAQSFDMFIEKTVYNGWIFRYTKWCIIHIRWFNIHFEAQSNKDTIKFCYFLKIFGLKVVKNKTTHTHGGLYDNVITNNLSVCSNLNYLPFSISDQTFIYYDIIYNGNKKAVTKYKIIRNLKNKS